MSEQDKFNPLDSGSVLNRIRAKRASDSYGGDAKGIVAVYLEVKKAMREAGETSAESTAAAILAAKIWGEPSQ